MDRTTGILTLDGIGHPLIYSECELFVGRLTINFAGADIEGSVQNLPFEDAFDFASLSGRIVDTPAGPSTKDNRDWLKPAFELHMEWYSIDSLHVGGINFDVQNNSLALHAQFTAVNGDNTTKIAVSLDAASDCVPIDSTRLIVSQQTIPIRFANCYLPLLGLPTLPEGVAMSDIVRIFGQPNYNGGGPHSRFGLIPIWIRYTLPNFLLRFQFVEGRATHFTVMPLGSIPGP